MSIPALNWAFKLPISGAATKSVLLVLANAANDKAECWPGISCIVKQSGARARIVTQILRDLEAGLLIRTAISGGRKSSLYTLLLENTDVATLHTVQGKRHAEATKRTVEWQRTMHNMQGSDHPNPAYSAHPTLHNTSNNHAYYAPKPIENHQREAEPPVVPQAGDSAVDEPALPVAAEATQPKPQPDLHEQTLASAPPEAAAPQSTTSSPEAAEPPPPRKARRLGKSRIDPAWQPNEAGITFAASKGIVDVDAEVAHFVGWHDAKGTTMLKWDMAWQNWCRMAEKIRQEREARRPASRTEIKNMILGVDHKTRMQQISRGIFDTDGFAGTTIDPDGNPVAAPVIDVHLCPEMPNASPQDVAQRFEAPAAWKSPIADAIALTDRWEGRYLAWLRECAKDRTGYGDQKPFEIPDDDLMPLREALQACKQPASPSECALVAEHIAYTWRSKLEYNPRSRLTADEITKGLGDIPADDLFKAIAFLHRGSAWPPCIPEIRKATSSEHSFRQRLLEIVNKRLKLPTNNVIQFQVPPTPSNPTGRAIPKMSGML